MEQTSRGRGRGRGRGRVFDAVNADVLQSILSRLPALAFASAACVSRSWYSACSRVLSRPKLASALSLNPNLNAAVDEVMAKVLSGPIRPHFALSCVGSFDLEATHRIITEKFGSKVPVITSESPGIIGREALTEELREVKWESAEDGDYYVEGHGIVLTVGFLPGLKVDAIPLWRPNNTCKAAMIEKFAMNISDYTESVSHCRTPDAILIFGASSVDMKPILNTLDCALSTDTSIVGNPSSNFLYQCATSKYSGTVCESRQYFTDAIALVFAKDRNKPHGTGEIHFSFGLSTGLLPVGPTYKVAAVKSDSYRVYTLLTARMQGSNEIFDGERLLENINHEMGNGIDIPDLYIGVMERRKYGVESRKVRLLTSLAFHEVLGGDEQELHVNGVGIKSGDAFQFYHSDCNIALSSLGKFSADLRNFAKAAGADNGKKNKREVFGGLVFCCCGRDESFFGRSKINSSPLTDNFMGVPVAGQFCSGEISRSSCNLILGESSQPSAARCSLHVYSTVYFVMSYIPLSPIPEHQ